MYCIDHGGKYPDNIKLLYQGTAAYLTRNLTCPAGGTYVFIINNNSKVELSSMIIYCSGKRHAHVLHDKDGEGPAFGSNSMTVDYKQEAK